MNEEVREQKQINRQRSKAGRQHGAAVKGRDQQECLVGWRGWLRVKEE